VAALATGVAVIGIALAAVLDEEEPADQKTVGIGEPGVDEDLTFKVTSIEAVQAIPVDEYSDPIVRRQGTKLIRVDLTYKNNTSDGIDPFCGGRSIVLLDRDERNFDPIDNYIDIAGNEICGDELQPGFKRSVTIAFQIPRDSKTLGVVLWNGESDDDYSGELSNVFVSKSGG
jgi:hypothetical protein